MLHSFSFWYFSHNGFDTPRAVFEVLQIIQVLSHDGNECGRLLKRKGCRFLRVGLVVNVVVLLWRSGLLQGFLTTLTSSLTSRCAAG